MLLSQKNITMPTSFLKYILLSLSISLVLFSCDEEEPEPQTEEATINNWIYDVMEEVYFWTDELPTNANYDQDPSVFFESLIFSDDRFSVIVPDYNQLINSLNGITLEAGYEFVLSAVQNSDDVIAIITYVKANSPAATASLRRGDIITHINGQLLTQNNFQLLLGEISDEHSIRYRRYNPETDQFDQQAGITLSVIQLSEDPIFLDSVYTIGSNKIGYLVYNFFSNGDGSNFDAQVRDVFGKFKSENITDLVLDLRYNSGGSINSATNLASLIAPGVTNNDVFYLNQWNDLYQNFWENDENGESQLKGFFFNVDNSVGNQISSKVYILTGSRTASASELMINGLDAYMDVTIIGGQTVGKNVGSIPIEDTDNAENDYGMLPIVIKIANKDGFSDYGDGFIPLGNNDINEFNTVPLLPFGQVEDPLLARAIELITGAPTSAKRTAGSLAYLPTEVLGHSTDRHIRSNRMILESDIQR